MNEIGRRKSTKLIRRAAVAIFVGAAAIASIGVASAQETTAPAAESNVDRTTIDIGVVVSDIDASLAFYRDGLGFRDAGAFDVPAEMGRDTGLSDGQPFHVHVLVLGEGESATRLKLMRFARAPGARPDNAFIHSTYGVRYLTIFVKDLDAALARAAKAGVKPLGKGAIDVPESIAPGLRLSLVRDPDGNLIELVGTKTTKATTN